MKKFLVYLFALIAGVHCDPRIIFRFYPTATTTVEYNINTFPSIFNHASFVRNRETVIFHFSEDQNLLTSQVHDVVSAYSSMQRANFIAITYANEGVVTTGNAVSIATGISTAVINLCEFGYNSALLNFIGNGLGAHIMARASRTIQSDSNRRHIVGRLTGLDPTNLGTISGLQIGRLSPSDAQWVESIHTDNSIGDHSSRGHVHFFVNGGTSQPMCTQALPSARARCNHDMVMTFWAESVRSIPAIFPALYCDAWSNYVTGACNDNLVANMGRSNSATNLRGAYFLRTNMQAPFTRNTALP